MSGDAIDATAAEIRASHEVRARAELEAADALCPGSDAVPWAGALLAEIALVKGHRGPAEESGGAALTGADGDAAKLALGRLGYDWSRAFRTLSRPEPGSELPRLAQRLRLQIEAVDAEVVIALDAVAASDLAQALGSPPLVLGKTRRIGGRTLLAVDGLEASLGDARLKRRVWNQMKAVARTRETER